MRLVRLILAWAAGAALTLGAPRASAERPSGVADRPSLYLSCATDCYASFLKQQLDYFDFARDPHDATFIAIVTRQTSSDGGTKLTVQLHGVLGESSGATADLQEAVSFPREAPIEDIRQALLQTIFRLLYARLAGTPHARAFSFSLPHRDGRTLSSLPDPWDYWVLTPEVSGFIDAGAAYHFIEIATALTVRRITEQSKFRWRNAFANDVNSYVLSSGERVSGSVSRWDSRLLLARSVHKQFSLGAAIAARGSQFENLAAHFHGGPLLEWNFFPYSENATRQLRLAYQIGPWVNYYIEPNQAGLDRELRAYHALSVVLDINRHWGSVQWLVQANQFLDDPALYRLSTGGNLAIRLARGLALAAEGRAAWVQDLINLRGRPIQDLELLLWTVQQDTDFMLQAELSLSYTFGSRHDTIVNPRFERIDVDEE